MADSNNGPLVTFLLLCYNQGAYVRQAIQAAFDQTYSPLEILISDDGSTDRGPSIILEMVSTYRGPHDVRCNLNGKNLGISRHLGRAFDLARGELVVVAAADDVSVPERTSRTVQHWMAEDRRASAVFCNALTLHRDGRPGTRHKGALGPGRITTNAIVSYCGGGPVLLGACSAYTPEVLTAFGKLLPNLLVEDIPLAVRASLGSGILYVDEELVRYRKDASVWVPRKIEGEPFERHVERLCRRSTANHLVAKQILRDVRGIADPETVRAAERRLLAFEFLVLTRRMRRFLALRFLQVLVRAARWREPLGVALLFAFPTLHRSIFRTHRWARRLLGPDHAR